MRTNIYVLVPTSMRDSITDTVLMECAEKYGVFKSSIDAINSVPDTEPYDAFITVKIE